MISWVTTKSIAPPRRPAPRQEQRGEADQPGAEHREQRLDQARRGTDQHRLETRHTDSGQHQRHHQPFRHILQSNAQGEAVGLVQAGTGRHANRHAFGDVVQDDGRDEQQDARECHRTVARPRTGWTSGISRPRMNSPITPTAKPKLTRNPAPNFE